MITSKIIDYTVHFPPLKHWHDLLPQYVKWCIKRNKVNEANERRLRMLLKTLGDGPRDHLRRRQVHGEWFEGFFRDVGYANLPNPSIPRSVRGEFSYDFSWLAWSQAATYAGAKKEPFSLSILHTIVEAGLEYCVSRLRDWREQPEEFCNYVNSLCDEDYQVEQQGAYMDSPAGSCNLMRFVVVNNRVLLAFQELLVWESLLDSVEKLKDMGMVDHGRQANDQVMSKGPIRNEFMNIQVNIKVLWAMHAIALQLAFALGKGKDYVKLEYANYHVIMAPFASTDSGHRLNQPLYKIREKSYFDAVLASLCGYGDFAHYAERFKFDHYLLEYEEALKEVPSRAEKISQYLHQSIGEAAMTMELFNCTTSIFTRQGQHDLKKKSDPGTRPTKKLVNRMEKIRAIMKDPAITLIELGVKGQMTPDLCKTLWRDWDRKAELNKQMKVIDKLFGEIGTQDTQGYIRWKDLYRFMHRCEFQIIHVGGSIFRFVPPQNLGKPFNHHRPHPTVTLDKNQSKAFGNILKERYGWSTGTFERVSNPSAHPIL